jgi:hypothetical protein
MCVPSKESTRSPEATSRMNSRNGLRTRFLLRFGDHRHPPSPGRGSFWLTHQKRTMSGLGGTVDSSADEGQAREHRLVLQSWCPSKGSASSAAARAPPSALCPAMPPVWQRFEQWLLGRQRSLHGASWSAIFSALAASFLAFSASRSRNRSLRRCTPWAPVPDRERAVSGFSPSSTCPTPRTTRRTRKSFC